MVKSQLDLKILLCAAMLVAGAAQTAFGQQIRPAITGISHMCVYAENVKASEHFYVHQLGATKGRDPESAQGSRYYLSPAQFIEVLPLPPDHTISRMGCVAFSTADAAGMKQYLLAHKIQVADEVHTGSDGSRWFRTKDPEGNTVEFIQSDPAATGSRSSNDTDPVGTRIIHVGYLVHSKAVEDQFFHGVLGFRPYWYGAVKADHIDWISQQVPDGPDWLEYMMVGDGSDTPVDQVDARQLGGMNHFSIGVTNMEQAVTKLIAEDRIGARHNGPQMGLDGKWQENLYDPDGTRVELMEFQPVVKPCCSAFTAESPTK